jgi:threonine dehydratase
MIRRTTILEPVLLARHFGTRILLATETFQHTGSFKFRAAWHVVNNVPNTHMIAASSGNFGQALAFASQLVDKRCTIVMPHDSMQVKVDAVRGYGATVDFVDVNSTSRAGRLEELAKEFPDAYFTNAYDNDLIIAGNSTLGRELAVLADVDTFIVPIGGGGLSSGIVKGLRDEGRQVDVYGAEPLLGNDAARSLREGHIVANEQEPKTIADGARTISLGKRNWAILKDGLKDIVEVNDERIAEALRMLFYKANLKVEPTGALSVGALLTDPDRFADRTICCLISGGNVDASVYARLLTGKIPGGL